MRKGGGVGQIEGVRGRRVMLLPAQSATMQTDLLLCRPDSDNLVSECDRWAQHPEQPVGSWEERGQ